jgi:hypothetical protein
MRSSQEFIMQVKRFPGNPIIVPHMDERMGANINGPSLIRAPAWLPDPLGAYYLYFAHHQGGYIRLAVADRLEGPWQTYAPGTLQLAQTPCVRHIASPDVHVDEAHGRLVMYYHGPVQGAGQCSFVATSKDGIHFTSQHEVLGAAYFRVFRWGGYWYVLAGAGRTYRSRDGFTAFERGPDLFAPDLRHLALRLEGDTLGVYYSNAYDCPERILYAEIALDADWERWTPSAPVTVLAPETDYEGVDLALEASVRGWAPERVRQLRDPAVFCEEGRCYLLYSVAGEHGIAIAEIVQAGGA